MLLLTTISDRTRSRGLCVAVVYCIGIVGWGILYGVSPIDVSKGGLRARCESRRAFLLPLELTSLSTFADFACCCLASAGYSNIPLIMAWVSGNSPSESQRAVSRFLCLKLRKTSGC